MTQQYDDTNRGIISKNLRKETEKHPDIKGQINIEGVEYWLDGWQRQKNDGSGSFYSLSAKRKDAPAAPAPAQKPAQRRAHEDEDIPF
jgi:hypothetical protein